MEGPSLLIPEDATLHSSWLCPKRGTSRGTNGEQNAPEHRAATYTQVIERQKRDIVCAALNPEVVGSNPTPAAMVTVVLDRKPAGLSSFL